MENFLTHNIFQPNIVTRAKETFKVETKTFNEFRQVQAIHKWYYLY